MPVMAVVMIGVDPHKASHTAVAINAAEEPLGQLRVRASAVQAERLLGWAQAWPERAWAVEGARCQLATELVEDLRGAGARIRETRKKAVIAVRAAGTSLTGLFGVGPVVAAAVIGDVRTVTRFLNHHHFASYNGTAPIEVS